MFGQLTRVIYPGGAAGAPPPPPAACPDIIDLQMPASAGCISGGLPTGDYLFEWSCLNCALIAPNSIEIVDVETGTVLATAVPTVDPISGLNETVVNIPYDVAPAAMPGIYRFRITATPTNPQCCDMTSELEIEFCLPIFSEGNMNPALTGAEIQSSLFETTRPRYPGIYPNGMSGYKYWALPTVMMENDGVIPRPTVIYQPNPQFANDFVDPNSTAIDIGSGITFNPQIAVEAPYTQNITVGGTAYPYMVFRTTHIMHSSVKWQVLDWI